MLEVPSEPGATAAPEEAATWKRAAELVAAALDADVLIHNGAIMRPYDRQLFDLVRARVRRPNVFFLLVTSGGDADAAYRMARCLQEYYAEFITFVPGVCKSAGTVIATGAHELVISDQGELGPLDVQMQKADELWETSSGLTVMEAINTLEETAYRMLEDSFLRIKFKSGGQITFKTATEVSVAIVTGLLEPIYRQIDPMHVGEAGRAMNVARDYGERLAGVGKNLKPGALNDLVALYSSHGFVIDRTEAATFFNRVRAPVDFEEELVDNLGDAGRVILPNEQPLLGYLSDEIVLEQEEATDGTEAGETLGAAGNDASPRQEVARAAGDVADPGGEVGG